MQARALSFLTIVSGGRFLAPPEHAWAAVDECRPRQPRRREAPVFNPFELSDDWARAPDADERVED